MKHLIYALRILKNYRLYSVINIVGLALSLACTVVITRYLYVEYTVDECHSRVDNICCVVEDDRSEGTSGLSYVYTDNLNTGAQNPLDDAAVVMHTNVYKPQSPIIGVGEREFEARIVMVDSLFGQIFDFPVEQGDVDICHGTVDAAITAEYGRKLFADQSPIGRSFMFDNRLITIRTVIGELSTKCSIQFDILINSNSERKDGFDLLLLAPGQTAEQLSQKYSSYNDYDTRYRFMPLKEVYFTPEVCTVYGTQYLLSGNMNTLAVLLIVALIVLVIGVFNFVNINTVLMLKRRRELGVKRVFGASGGAIIRGIYFENFIMVACAVVLGWVLVSVGASVIVGELGIEMVNNPQFDLLLSLGILVVLPIVTSIYPYLKQKYAQPITSIQNIGGGSRSLMNRSVFLVGQYVMTISIVIISIFFITQLDYMLSRDVGYRSSDIIKVRMFRPLSYSLTPEQNSQQTALRKANEQVVVQRMNSCPIFSMWQYTESPNEINAGYKVQFAIDGDSPLSVSRIYCSESYMKLFDLKLKSGRWWQDAVDKAENYDMIVNEAFLKKFGIKDYTSAQMQPSERLWTKNDGTEQTNALMQQNPPYRIIGVVGDFQVGHSMSGIEPMAIFFGNFNSTDTRDLCAQINPGRQQEAIEFLRQLHSDAGSGEFRFTMIKDEISAIYAEDKKVTLIYSSLAMIALLISSLGLFGLSLYDVQQRYREIALRRVNGATVKQIISLLLYRYYILLAIALLIAMPVSWLVIDWYMQDFIVKIPMSWWIFVLAASITAFISLLTLIFQTIRAAHTNPAVATKAA